MHHFPFSNHNLLIPSTTSSFILITLVDKRSSHHNLWRALFSFSSWHFYTNFFFWSLIDPILQTLPYSSATAFLQYHLQLTLPINIWFLITQPKNVFLQHSLRQIISIALILLFILLLTVYSTVVNNKDLFSALIIIKNWFFYSPSNGRIP